VEGLFERLVVLAKWRPLRGSRIRVEGGKLETVEPIAAPNEGVFLGWFGLDSSDAILSTQDIGRHQMYTITLSDR
jgi:hypothetical protein